MKAEFKKNMFKRIFIFAIAVAFLFSVDGARLFYLQLVNGSELSAKAESQQLSDTEIPAMRGTIYDSEGNVLAQSATVWNVFIDRFDTHASAFSISLTETIITCTHAQNFQLAP